MAHFSDVFVFSYLIDENEFFIQYFDEEYKPHYRLNYFQLKFQPQLQEFLLIEQMHQAFSKEYDLKYMKFHWPQDTGLTSEIFGYLNDNDYKIGNLELYALNPNNFHSKKSKLDVKIKMIEKPKLKQFNQFNYEFNLEYGKNFAELSKGLYKDMFSQENITFIGAFLNQQMIGSLNLIETDKYIEIDQVGVHSHYRNLGIALELVSKAVQVARGKNKEIILAADGEETVKKMYQKQGFKYQASQIHILKKGL